MEAETVNDMAEKKKRFEYYRDTMASALRDVALKIQSDQFEDDVKERLQGCWKSISLKEFDYNVCVMLEAAAAEDFNDIFEHGTGLIPTGQEPAEIEYWFGGYNDYEVKISD